MRVEGDRDPAGGLPRRALAIEDEVLPRSDRDRLAELIGEMPLSATVPK
jgi:hypothetical protein